jgi:hypothetical protein
VLLGYWNVVRVLARRLDYAVFYCLRPTLVESRVHPRGYRDFELEYTDAFNRGLT